MRSNQKKKKKEEAISNPPLAPVQVPVVVASFNIQRLSNGSVQYYFGGHESDVLGLVEYGKIMVSDKARLNIANSATQPIQPSPPPEAL